MYGKEALRGEWAGWPTVAIHALVSLFHLSQVGQGHRVSPSVCKAIKPVSPTVVLLKGQAESSLVGVGMKREQK